MNDVAAAARRALLSKTKPPYSLGRLEDVAVRVAVALGTERPVVRKGSAIVFAADHGVAAEGVSAYPPEVTYQMVANMLRGGAVVNVLARSVGVDVTIVDAGVRGGGGLPDHPRFVRAPVADGTRNFAESPAMTVEECRAAVERGRQVISDVIRSGADAVALGEMGIGNTTSAAALLSCLHGVPPRRSAGRGTGIDDARLAKKIDVITGAIDALGPARYDPMRALAHVGGFEIAMLVGAILAAADEKVVILVDGFVVTAALLVARALAPDVPDRCVPCHRSAEGAHGLMLDILGLEPVIELGMRLGEGSGAVLAYPVVRAAAALLTETATFSEAGVSGA